MLNDWLASKKADSENLLFSVSGRVPEGKERKTHLMMMSDLERARTRWIKEAENDPTEVERRQESDFLKYENSEGPYADFHSNRHLFITSLERAGLSPKMTQTLARHRDIRLTLGVYTHVGVHDQTVAISSLPAPPSESFGQMNEAAALAATGTNGPVPKTRNDKTASKKGARIGAEGCRKWCQTPRVGSATNRT